MVLVPPTSSDWLLPLLVLLLLALLVCLAMVAEGVEGSAASPDGSSFLPFAVQLLLLLLLSLHAVAVGFWGVAFLRDLSRNRRNTEPLTSAELNRRERERLRAERDRLGLAPAKTE